MESQFAALLADAVSKPGVLSTAYSAFHNYSLGNQMNALFQCAARDIPLGPIATFMGWKAIADNSAEDNEWDAVYRLRTNEETARAILRALGEQS